MFRQITIAYFALAAPSTMLEDYVATYMSDESKRGHVQGRHLRGLGAVAPKEKEKEKKERKKRKKKKKERKKEGNYE